MCSDEDNFGTFGLVEQSCAGSDRLDAGCFWLTPVEPCLVFLAACLAIFSACLAAFSASFFSLSACFCAAFLALSSAFFFCSSLFFLFISLTNFRCSFSFSFFFLSCFSSNKAMHFVLVSTLAPEFLLSAGLDGVLQVPLLKTWIQCFQHYLR